MSKFYCSHVRFPGRGKQCMDHRQFFESPAAVPLASITLETQRLFPEAMVIETREIDWADIPDGSPIEDSRPVKAHSPSKPQNRS